MNDLVSRARTLADGDGEEEVMIHVEIEHRYRGNKLPTLLVYGPGSPRIYLNATLSQPTNRRSSKALVSGASLVQLWKYILKIFNANATSNA